MRCADAGGAHRLSGGVKSAVSAVADSAAASVIAYDTVKVGDCLGVAFEMLRSDTLGHAMRDNPEKLAEYVDRYAALAKTLRNTHVPAGGFTPIHDVLRERADKLSPWALPEEIALLHSLIDDIPEAAL